MDRTGAWSLSPAFDITWSYNPDGAWTAKHQMSMNGKRDGFTREDFRACAKTAGLKRGRAELILDEVTAAVLRWPDFAAKAKVAPAWRNDIASTLRTEIPAS
jgi:serine/threonine-protein kinase HipA